MIQLPELPIKDPGSAIVVTCGFAKRLDPGETITACNFIISPDFGDDQNASEMASGAVDLSEAPVMKQKVIGGLHGVRYLLKFLATTSKGLVRVGSAVLPVQNGGA